MTISRRTTLALPLALLPAANAISSEPSTADPVISAFDRVRTLRSYCRKMLQGYNALEKKHGPVCDAAREFEATHLFPAQDAERQAWMEFITTPATSLSGLRAKIVELAGDEWDLDLGHLKILIEDVDRISAIGSPQRVGS